VETQNTNKPVETENTSENPPSQPKAKKRPYTAPSFKFEKVFEVSALSCGKVFGNENSCHFSRKTS
jgi:hypothetical protein